MEPQMLEKLHSYSKRTISRYTTKWPPTLQELNNYSSLREKWVVWHNPTQAN